MFNMAKNSFILSSRYMTIILCCCIFSLTAHYLTVGMPNVVDSFWQQVLDEHTSDISDVNDHHSDDNYVLPVSAFGHNPGGLAFMRDDLALNRLSHSISPQLPPPKLNNQT